MKPRLRSISLLKYDSVFSSSKIGGAYDANMDGIWLFFFESNRGLTPDEFLKSCSCPVLPTELLVCLEWDYSGLTSEKGESASFFSSEFSRFNSFKLWIEIGLDDPVKLLILGILNCENYGSLLVPRLRGKCKWLLNSFIDLSEVSGSRADRDCFYPDAKVKDIEALKLSAFIFFIYLFRLSSSRLVEGCLSELQRLKAPMPPTLWFLGDPTALEWGSEREEQLL